MEPDPIDEIEATTVRLPLPATLRLGPMVISERQYAVVRVRTRSGLTGYAYGQTRGAPVTALITDLLAPILLGADSTAVAERWRDAFRGTVAVGRVGLVIRAIGLIDIALWDLRGQRESTPVYRLLGGRREEVPVMFVAGYPASPGDVDTIVETSTRAAAAGHQLVKIARSLEPAVTQALLQQMHEALPSDNRVVVDCNWAWSEPAHVVQELRSWPTDRLAWIEDAFPPEEIEAYRALRKAGLAPVGVGDELTDPSVYRSLIGRDALDVLRLDLTAIGGFTRAGEVVRLAESAGVPISFHVYPEISAHGAAAWQICESIETFDRTDNPYDPSHLLIEGGPAFKDGVAHLPSTPGLGFTIDPDRFRR